MEGVAGVVYYGMCRDSFQHPSYLYFLLCAKHGNICERYDFHGVSLRAGLHHHHALEDLQHGAGQNIV